MNRRGFFRSMLTSAATAFAAHYVPLRVVKAPLAPPRDLLTLMNEALDRVESASRASRPVFYRRLPSPSWRQFGDGLLSDADRLDGEIVRPEP